MAAFLTVLEGVLALYGAVALYVTYLVVCKRLVARLERRRLNRFLATYTPATPDPATPEEGNHA